MSEIKTKLKKLDFDQVYISMGDEYVVTEHHSISDVLRFLIKENGAEEVLCLVLKNKKVKKLIKKYK